MDKQQELKSEIAKHFGYNYYRAIDAFDENYHETFNAIWGGGDLVFAKEVEDILKAWQ